MPLNRTDARKAVFSLLFETDFRPDENTQAIFDLSCENREIEPNAYVHDTYFGVLAHLSEIDELINKHANGWKTSRISYVSRAILRLCVYEMLYSADIPNTVSINEAVELCKEFDAEEARPFLNGVLNAVKDEILASRHE